MSTSRSRTLSSAAPLATAMAAPLNVMVSPAAESADDQDEVARFFVDTHTKAKVDELLALAQNMADGAIQKSVDEFVQRVMTQDFCAGKTSLVDGEPVLGIVEDFYE